MKDPFSDSFRFLQTEIGQIETIEYHWYVLGCVELGMRPEQQAEFSRLFALYTRCDRILTAYESVCRQPDFWRSQGAPEERLRTAQMVTNIRREQERLRPLQAAVLAGRRVDGEGGAGVTARLQPIAPTLVGAAAKLPPHLDREPDVRHP